MDLNQLILWGIIPAALVALAGMLVRRVSGRRFLLFLLAVNAALLLTALVAGWLPSAQDGRLAFMIPPFLAPATLGVLALVLLHLKDYAALQRSERRLALALGLGNVALLAGVGGQSFGMGSYILSGAVMLAIVWMAGTVFRPMAVVLAVASLALLGSCNALNTTSLNPPQPPPFLIWLSPLLQILISTLPGLVPATAAVLASTALKPRPQSGKNGGAAWWPVFWRLVLAAALLSYLTYTIVWTSIWDNTSDGLGGLFLTMSTSLVAVGAGMVMATVASGWRRLGGLVFAGLVLAAVFEAFNYGWSVSYHTLTESRAARLQTAVEHFHTRTGSYPAELRQLIPNEVWWIPEPVILRGQGWCYQGGKDYYRLGAAFREYWGRPLSIRLYASTGTPPEASWACDEKLAELKSRYDPPPDAMLGAAPTLAPLPTSAAATPRTVVPLLVQASPISMGDWSPDGSYLVFGVPQISGDQPVIDLRFLNAKTGAVCPASGTKWATAPMSDGIRRQFAWLPDGRLLFVSESGELLLFRPCASGVENLAGRYPETFIQASAYDARSGRVLLKTQEAYWLLDGNSLQARLIAGVSPNPYEAHWDNYAWSPGGERLAIARLNGREKKAGATLYVVAGDTGEVEKSLPLEMASDQSAPWLEWLSHDELLAQSEGALRMVDFRPEPPKVTDVIKDIFLLDIAYPMETSSMASIENKTGGYHIAVRVNHPRDQGIYLYHSETGQVEVLQSEVDLLLFFPDGQFTELTKVESSPTYRDEFDLVWVDTPGAETRRLAVQGHVPRQYPMLFPRYLPASARMAFSSSQGVSVVSIPDGKLVGFWELDGGGGSFSTSAYASPDSQALVPIADGVGLYYISLPNK
jgi:hypothetical protein